MSHFTAFIPLRGGSKSIPRKNIKLIAGYPLFYWSLKAALDSGSFDQIVVSTEDEEIKNVVNHYFPESVSVDQRPSHLAADDTSTEAVVLDYLKRSEADVFVLIQATSPLVSSEDFVKAKDYFIENKFDSMLSACEFKRFLWSNDGKPINYDPQSRPRRQEFDGAMLENGAFYFTKTSVYNEYKNRLGGKIGIFPMAEETAYELDEPVDWIIIEELLRAKKELKIREKLKKIKALVIDVDGTLTDGGMYYSESGEELKKFNTKDAKGLELLKKSGFEVCVITAEDSPRVHSRMKKMQVSKTDYFFGVKDKLPVLKQWCEMKGFNLENIAYAGDDLGDLECMTHSGFSLCPADSVDSIKKTSDFISNYNGGEAFIRRFIDKFLLP